MFCFFTNKFYLKRLIETYLDEQRSNKGKKYFSCACIYVFVSNIVLEGIHDNRSDQFILKFVVIE